MATALIVTIATLRYNEEHDYFTHEPISITSQTMTFVDIKPAQAALEAIEKAHGDKFIVTGTILKDVVI